MKRGAHARSSEERVRHAPGAPKVNLGNQIKAVFLAPRSRRRETSRRRAKRKERTDPRENEEEEEEERGG